MNLLKVKGTGILEEKEIIGKKLMNNVLRIFQRDKIKSFFLNKKLYIAIGIICSITIVILLSIYFIDKFVISKSKPKEFKVSIYQRLDELKKSHNYYKKIATKEEFIVRWIEMFSNATYKNDGDPKKGEYDCLGAVIEYLRRWGANVKLENIPLIIQRTELLSKLDQLEIRKSSKNVRPGDILIFKPVKGTYHLGIIWNITKNGDVQYMDMNSRTGIGFETLGFGNDKIFRIMEVSYSFWYGDYMVHLNK